MSKQRLDKALVDRNLCRSRQNACELIAAGKVLLNNKPCLHSAQSVTENDSIELIPNDVEKYVSRGGLKLEAALRHFDVSVDNKVCLDVGQSTGGFTDCLLHSGASLIVGLDVGTGQLAPVLRRDSRVICLEKMNFRDIDLLKLKAFSSKGSFDIVVADLSFISIQLVAEKLAAIGDSGTQYVFLVKPQFEVGPKGLERGGIVKNPELRKKAVDGVSESLVDCGLVVKLPYESPVLGGDGNQEFFLYCIK